MAGKFQVGTSGWHYSHWRGSFYPSRIRSADMLAFYCERLATVEINNSFYHLPARETFRQWRRQTPPGFCFAVKGSRYITHMKKLKDPRQAVRKFFAHIRELGPKLGPILFQLPPRWGRDVARLRDFLRSLPPRHRYAFEFRDSSWFDSEVYTLLEKYNAALCVFDLAGFQSPLALTADFVYLRLHGPAAQAYAGRYTRAQLRGWLGRCRQWLKQGAREVFVYFDNDQAGYAGRNALELQRMLSR